MRTLNENFNFKSCLQQICYKNFDKLKKYSSAIHVNTGGRVHLITW